MEKKRARWASNLSLSLSPPSSSSAASSGVLQGGAVFSGVPQGGGAATPDEGGRDFLTELPDAIRLHIISLLPLKYAIRTGALSSRWRSLWLHRWAHPSSLGLSPTVLLGGAVASADVFVASVDQCLASRGRSRRMDGFSLDLPPGRRYDEDIKRWIGYAASCDVEDLQIVMLPPFAATTSARSGRRVWGKHRLTISNVHFNSICECTNLARIAFSGLRLSGPVSSIKRISFLEVICLHGGYVTDGALRRIVAACPLLRSLDLRFCRRLRQISITANSRLTSITIVECLKTTSVTISAPALRCFKFKGAYLTSYSFDSPERLEEVYMSAGSPDSSLSPSNWVKVIAGLSNIGVLTLCNLSLQYIVVAGANAVSDCRNFRNLKELQLVMGMMTNDNLMDIYGFFKLCKFPRLEKLYIELPTTMHDSFVEKYLMMPTEELPEVEFQYLKIIKINNFKGHNNEMQLAKFLLEKACFLEFFVVIACREFVVEGYNDFNVDDCSDFLHFLMLRLSLFTKASPKAQIILSEHDNCKFVPTHWEVL